MNNSIRIIKKYANRRLYDMIASSYITLDDVKALVMQHIKFRVVDAKTEEDMTNSILLQIISEQESHSATPIFTAEMLQNVIRFYGNSMQNVMSQYLDQGIQLFAKQYIDLQKHTQETAATDPFAAMTTLAKQSLSIWQSVLGTPFAAQKPAEQPETTAKSEQKTGKRSDK